jgi:hypothetical protein
MDRRAKTEAPRARSLIGDAKTGTMRLRERAEPCRGLARYARTHGIARELEKLAGDYDRDAERFDRLGSAFRTAILQ